MWWKLYVCGTENRHSGQHQKRDQVDCVWFDNSNNKKKIFSFDLAYRQHLSVCSFYMQILHTKMLPH